MVKKGLWNVTHIHWFLKGPSFHFLLSLQAKLWSKKLAKRSLVVVLCRSVLLLFQKHKRKHLLSKKRELVVQSAFSKSFSFFLDREPGALRFPLSSGHVDTNTFARPQGKNKRFALWKLPMPKALQDGLQKRQSGTSIDELMTFE